MNRTEVADLLAFIEGIERRPFPPGAVDAWLTLFVQVEYADAMKAVREAFDTSEPLKGPVQPGPIRRRALAIAATRRGGALRELEAAYAQAVEPNREYLKARAALAAKLGDLNREIARRSPARADSTMPTSPDSEITDERRQAAARSILAGIGRAA